MDESNCKRTAVLLDPYPLWFEAVEEVLSRISVEVVGRAAEPEAALSLLEEQRPDILVAEIVRGREIDGIACLRLARQTNPELKVVVLSSSDEPQQIEAAFAAGATVYALKKAHPDDLVSAIRQSFDQSVFFAATEPESVPAGSMANGSFGLTRREVEILRLLAEGYSNAALAKMLWITEQTVKFHLSNIYRKLGVSNRTEASRWAQIHNILAAGSRIAAPVA